MLAFLQHLFTPHQTNNHRPKALHPQALLLYILFFLVLQFNLANLRLILPNILGLATDINVESLLEITNQKRIESSLSPLNLDPQLSQAAVGKAADMFTKDYWAHNAPDGLTPWVFVKNAGYNYLYAGENLAKNFDNSEGVVKAWLASPSHRANLLKPEYQDVGFAVVNGRLGGEETTLVVQVFGAKQGAQIAVQPPAPSPTFPPLTRLIQPTAPPAVVETTPAGEREVATVVAQMRLPQLAAASAKNQPIFNLFALTKNSSLFLMGLLMLVLSLDAFLIWRRKTVRIAGHNFAHFLFFTTMVLAILITQQGVIR